MKKFGLENVMNIWFVVLTLQSVSVHCYTFINATPGEHIGASNINLWLRLTLGEPILFVSC